MDHDTLTLLAQEGPCSVELCPCGALHVTVGAVTLRLHPRAADALGIVLARAIAIAASTSLVRPHRDRPAD